MFYKKRSDNFIDQFTSFSFILPALILFAIFNIYTFFDLFRLSFLDTKGLPNSEEVFVGLANYIYVLSDKVWWASVGRATIITILALTVQNALALILALLVDRGVRGNLFYKVVFFLPPVLSGVVVGIVWGWIFDGYDGIFNHFLSIVNLDQFSSISWLANENTALFTVAFIHMWKGFGWGFVILLAGLQNIDTELYEAAEVDGAAWWPQFYHITIPFMIPVFVLVSILTILGSMQIYDIIVATTNGGPGFATEVPITRIFESMSSTVQRFGVASAQGVVFGILLLFVSLGQINFSNRYKV